MERDLLLEIGVEEMPSLFMSPALEELRATAERKLEENRIEYQQIKTLGTPRRLVLLVQGVAEKQGIRVIESRGPKKNIAFDGEGRPSKAALGFARSQGVDPSDLETREVGGIEYLFATRQEGGGNSEELLPNILLEIIHSVNFPKSMRWGYRQERFARPIRWLLALYGEQPLSIEVSGVDSASITYGHRFLSSGALPIKAIPEYFSLLRENYVIVDQDERRDLIWSQIQVAAQQAGGRAKEDRELLEEITFLLEYPTAFYGEFSESYLEVPPEVLITSMKEHQRYFPVFDQEDKLLPGFIGVRNGTDYCLDIVRAGNQRVLKARLEDALFFWKEDTGKPLAELVPGLQDILFHERLGSLKDKVSRLQKLAAFIGEEMGTGSLEIINRAALLCKADLLSSMVYEFPELQGIMGRYYALYSGEDKGVAQAIYEHYLPRFAGDELPVTSEGIALALAEKVDNLTGFFAIGTRPSGSQDPYALRRQALGIVNVILKQGLQLKLPRIIAAAYRLYQPLQMELSQDETVGEIIDFILQRLRGVMLEKGLPYDVIDAVLQPAFDLEDINLRAEVIKEFKTSSDYEDFLVVFNRSNNLSRQWQSSEVNLEILAEPAEKNLYECYLRAKELVQLSLDRRRYYEALLAIAQIRPSLDRFFTAVMVMVEDEELKAARLGILKLIALLCSSIADFTKLVQ